MKTPVKCLPHKKQLFWFLKSPKFDVIFSVTNLLAIRILNTKINGEVCKIYWNFMVYLLPLEKKNNTLTVITWIDFLLIEVSGVEVDKCKLSLGVYCLA